MVAPVSRVEGSAIAFRFLGFEWTTLLPVAFIFDRSAFEGLFILVE
jgi:hypothetical protein